MKSLKNTLPLLAVASFGLLLALLMIEIIFRFAIPLLNKPSWSDRPKFFYRPATAKTMQDYAYPKKQANSFRIAVIGDSFSFATMMQFDDAFPKRLERMINLGDSPTRFEVINYGVPGNSTSHEVEWTKRAIRDEADLILLQITLNDPQIKSYTPTGLTGVNEFGAYQAQGITRQIFNYWKSLEFIAKRWHNLGTRKRYQAYYDNLFADSKNMAHFNEAIQSIKKHADTHQVALVSVVFPLFGLPLNDTYPFHHLHRRVHETLNAEKIPFLDLFAAYKGIPLERIHVIPGLDYHPNEIGHRIAAETIYTWLAAQAALPNAALIDKRYSSRISIIPKNNNKL